MRAALMRTLNDFSIYEIVSGWSTHEKLACTYCMENNKAFTLTNKGNFFFWLPLVLLMDHRYIKNINDFFVGRIEKDIVPPRLSSEELYNVVLEYGDIVFDFQYGKQKFHSFGLTHNWVNQSILFELLLEFRQAHNYVLFNCDELRPFIH